MSERKLIFLIGDGMADLPIPELGGKTPLEHARTPHMDLLARQGILGLVRTVPRGMPPGSDTANLSIFGYDPSESYSGRAPLEALSMGLDLGPRDAAFRCNIVSINDGIMEDFSAGHIESEFAAVVIRELAAGISRKNIELYPGVSYRHILIWRDYPYDAIIGSTPPHDIQGQSAADHLPRGEGSDVFKEIMEQSARIIAGSPAIKAAAGRHRGKPQSVWFWGGGRKPNMKTLKERMGLSGHTISAVDLIHGIGKAAGLTRIEVPGATGYIDTDYAGKARAALAAMANADFMFLHVESPDESGHEGNLAHKLQAIEDFDAKVVGPIIEGMKKFPRYAILVMPDHPTPIAKRTHTDAPVPFALYWSDGSDPSLAGKGGSAFTENAAAATGLRCDQGHRLIDLALRKKCEQVMS